MDFLELSKKIILIDSTPTVGNEEIAYFCKDICTQAGFEVTLQGGWIDGKKQYNVIARPPNSSKKDEVIFQTHLDTVEPGPLVNWTKTDYNPFKATIEDGKIYGLGTADVKLDFLCKFRALKEFLDKDMKNPFVLVGTYGEEVGMQGAHLLMRSKAIQSRNAIIGEPSELQIVYGNNGYMVMHFDIPFTAEEKRHRDKQNKEHPHTTQEKIFSGKAAHSSTPHLGDNAIAKLIGYLRRLPAGIALLEVSGGTGLNVVPSSAHVEVDADVIFSGSQGGASIRLIALADEFQKLEREFQGFDDPQFFPPTPTLNMALLNTTEAGIRLGVSFRLTPQISDQQIEKWVEQLQTGARKAGIQSHLERRSVSALTPLDSPLVVGAREIAGKLGLSEKPITKSAGTECSVYRPHGIDCIVFGPGVSIGNSHTANEYNVLSQLDRATEFYSECVKRFCL